MVRGPADLTRERGKGQRGGRGGSCLEEGAQPSNRGHKHNEKYKVILVFGTCVSGPGEFIKGLRGKRRISAYVKKKGRGA